MNALILDSAERRWHIAHALNGSTWEAMRLTIAAGRRIRISSGQLSIAIRAAGNDATWEFLREELGFVIVGDHTDWQLGLPKAFRQEQLEDDLAWDGMRGVFADATRPISCPRARALQEMVPSNRSGTGARRALVLAWAARALRIGALKREGPPGPIAQENPSAGD